MTKYMPSTESNIQFKLPSANVIGDKCQTPGDCVVQVSGAIVELPQVWTQFPSILAHFSSSGPLRTLARITITGESQSIGTG